MSLAWDHAVQMKHAFTLLDPSCSVFSNLYLSNKTLTGLEAMKILSQVGICTSMKTGAGESLLNGIVAGKLTIRFRMSVKIPATMF